MALILSALCIGAAWLLYEYKHPLDLPDHEGMNMTTRQKFHSDFLTAAKSVEWKGIPVHMALSMAEVETGAGTGNVFKQTNNLFSITQGSTWKGDTYKSGLNFTFRKYPSWQESMKDWVHLMTTVRLYATAYQRALAHDYKGFFSEVQKAGYAGSDTLYARKLSTVYESLGVPT